MLSWKKFAVAVELFVEVETATHRLSEVMKKDPKFYHVPGWFEYVSALGASLLVEATGKLFRDYKPNDPDALSDSESDSGSDSDPENDSEGNSEAESDSGSSSDSDIEAVDELTPSTAEPTRVQPLLSLEYLVSSLSIFQATVPHDTIYALLAIAKDTTPSASDEDTQTLMDQTKHVLEVFTEKKRYRVEYGQPFVDVCKDFVQFCIEHSDQTRALDVICRPWAPEPQKRKRRLPLPQKRARESVNSKITNGIITNGNTDTEHHQIPHSISEDGSNHTNSLPETPPPPEPRDNMPMPSWIPKLSGAAYAMYSQAGVHELKMGRKNADTLVGLPPSFSSLERNYNAAQTKVLDPKALKFRRRTKMKHYSMYVKGFVLDTVLEVQPSSQGGAIPREWAKAAGWRHAPDDDPPDDFWRTLVADRGRDGRNPPVYYSRACKESFFKGGLQSGRVDTTDLINNERCSVVAQFCRRVQAVIWNRSLIRTAETKRLGLANQNALKDDLVCILYGCSAPVILRRREKDAGDIDKEVEEDIQHWRLDTKSRILRNFRRIKKFREKRKSEKEAYLKWDQRMREEWEKDDKWRHLREEVLKNDNASKKQHASDAPPNSTKVMIVEAERLETEQRTPKSTLLAGPSKSDSGVLPSDLPLPDDDSGLFSNEISSDEAVSFSDAQSLLLLNKSGAQGAPSAAEDSELVEKEKKEAENKRKKEELQTAWELILEKMAEERPKDKEFKAWKTAKRAEARKAEIEQEKERLKEEERETLERKEAMRGQAKRKKSKRKDRKEERQVEPQPAKFVEKEQGNSTQDVIKSWNQPRVNWRKFELRLKFGRRWKRIVRMRKILTRTFGECVFLWRRNKTRPQIQAKMRAIPVEPSKDKVSNPSQQTVANGYSSSDRRDPNRSRVQETTLTTQYRNGFSGTAARHSVSASPLIDSQGRTRSKTFPNQSSKQDSNHHTRAMTLRPPFDPQANSEEINDTKTTTQEDRSEQRPNGNSELPKRNGLVGGKADKSKASCDAYLEPLRAQIKGKYLLQKESKEMKAEEQKLGRELQDGEKEDLKKRVKDHNKRVPDNMGYHEFLGECYIHGMMDGEAMGYQNNYGEEPIPARVFELR